MTHFKKKNKKSKSKFRNWFFDLKWKNEFQKIYFIFHIWLLNWKKKNEKKLFLNLFWFKINLKKQKSKFSNSFFNFKSKNKSQKVLSFFNFGYEIENEIFKISFVFKSKNELYFRYTHSDWLPFSYQKEFWFEFLTPSFVFHFHEKMKDEIQFVFRFLFSWRNWKRNYLKISRLTLWLFSQV